MWHITALIDHMAGTREKQQHYVLDVSGVEGGVLSEPDAVMAALEILCDNARDEARTANRPREIIVATPPHMVGRELHGGCEAKAEWSVLAMRYRDDMGDQVRSRDPRVLLFPRADAV